ncbi:hypothetical protein HWI92_19800 [Dyadobacter sandarakinus]|uniref:Lipoprotein with Yx(FWY)xxD motif n=2 Tax=Dyadobacter sandarakinus TaxID=2747268 RepID=A0ABX7IE60_9BACT|nr:hypothetical protein HWI92_19800 [Dyadobacter sandarakinus]
MLWALSLVALFTISCSDNDGDGTTPEPAANVKLQSTTLGQVLADQNGRTLYFFSKDLTGASTCTGNCLQAWPAFTVTDLNLADGLDSTVFSTITRPDGAKQVTYKGWPLYYYKDDVAAGDVKGENVGGVWFVAKTNYSVMLANGQLVGNDGKSYKADQTEGTAETQFFVDGMGRTLYAFANDKNKKNNYTKEDFSNDGVWPIYISEINDLPSVMDKSLFSVIDVFGKKQLTYKGWPLYYFGPDAKVRGATKGVSVPRPGVWPIVQINSPSAPN